jgi:hypothetical protein
MSDFFSGNALDWMKGAGTLIGGLGSVWSGLEQAKAFKKMNNINTDMYNRIKDKEDRAQLSLDTAVNNVYGAKMEV